MKEITKLEMTSLNDFGLHTEECQADKFALDSYSSRNGTFRGLVCAGCAGMTGGVGGRSGKDAGNGYQLILLSGGGGHTDALSALDVSSV